MLKQEYKNMLRRLDQEAPTEGPAADADLVRRYRERSELKAARVFYDWLEAGMRGVVGNIRPKPIVGYFCKGVPEELILSCRAIPVRLCSADPDYARAGEKIMQADVCPLIKSIGGAFQYPSFRRLDVIVVPSTCDGKTQLAQWLSPWADIYVLDLPRENDYLKNGDLWAERYDQFYRFLKARFDVKPTRRDLLRVCEMTNRRTAVFRDIFQFRTDYSEAINAFDYFAMTSASFFISPERWTQQAEHLLAEAFHHKKYRKGIGNGKRLLLAGSPVMFPNFKILEVLDQAGCHVAMEMLCSAYGRLFDPVVLDEETEEGIVRSLSLKYIAAGMCPCFLSLNKFLDNLLENVHRFHLDGVVYHTLRLCQVFDVQGGMIRQVLKAKRIPFLTLKTDLGREDIGQLKTRVEAFVEMLK